MTEGFLGRWSRRKRAALRPTVPPPEPAPPPADLPDPDALGTASDYTPFLQRGVEPEVQSAALRRAWTTDAGIAGFRGMGEYDWDFNAPGYGQLAAQDDVARLLDAVLAGPPEALATSEVTEDPPAEPPAPAPQPVIAAQTESEPLPPPPRRHGGARPA